MLASRTYNRGTDAARHGHQIASLRPAVRAAGRRRD